MPKPISRIRTRNSFALLGSALVCLRGSRTRRVPCDITKCWYWRRSRWRSRPIGLSMCFLAFKCFFIDKLHLLIGKLLRKVNSNRFISRLMDQKLTRIIYVYVIHWDFWLVISWNFNCKGVLPEFCIDIDHSRNTITYHNVLCLSPQNFA